VQARERIKEREGERGEGETRARSCESIRDDSKFGKRIFIRIPEREREREERALAFPSFSVLER